jgi:uncharacterized protein YwqG
MPLYPAEKLSELPQFDDLASALKNPQRVIRLDLHRPEESAQLERVAELSNLQSLSISLAKLDHLLPRLPEMKDLQDLSFQACNLAVFPDCIFQLPNLYSLSLGNNHLRELPVAIADLVKLQELRLAQNELESIPDSIGKIKGLSILGFSYNRLESLPESIGHLCHLEWLFLDVNRLRSLPDELVQLTSLRSLDLNSNKLSTLPEGICNLQKLERLSIERNPFESLPACIARMPNLKELAIEASKRSLFMDWTYQPSSEAPKLRLSDLQLFVTRESELFQPLQSAIQEAQLTAFEEVLLRRARAAIQIESTAPDDYSIPGISRLGGFPDLVDASKFPKTDKRYWIFLAQINLAEIASLNHFLPRKGLLSFFADSTESLSCRVLFYDGDTGALKTIHHAGAEEMLSPEDDYTQAPYRVRFRPYFSLPHDPPPELRDSEHFSAEGLHLSVDHQINGYTFTQHESPQEQAAMKLRGSPEEWIPLLQLGWDEHVGFCFWDAGTLTFSIHQEDLRRWNFDKVYLSLESS